ncbi:M20/M25/M40 family metallo-hydrolase [Streptomyces sp. NPDC058471]|uniref:M20/M25/M40 family metallo-hydrolase n=1 Tax=Streptomyces sp. NPDC058471 TaxID=3346516 RepID=UPI00364D2FD2
MSVLHTPYGGPVSHPHAVGLLRRMLEIESPSYQEDRIGAYLVQEMKTLGYDRAWIDDAGNAIGVIDRGPGPVVMLLGHMDTVEGEVPVRIESDRLFGRGAVDAKGPLATMICAAASAADFRGTVIVVGAVEEETPGSRGAMEIRRTHSRPDALVIGEPSGWNTVVLGYKGKLDLTYRVQVEATHPSNPLPKASELAADAWQQLLDLLGPDAGHGSFDTPGPTLVSFTGDLVTARAEFSIRTPIGFDDTTLVRQLRERLPQGEVEVVNAVRAVRTTRTDPVVRALARGIRAHDERPTMKVKTATSDMNTLAEVWDIPMATYGPGDSRLDHADDEHILLSEYFNGIRVLTSALEQLSDAGSPLPTARPAALTLAGATA